MHHQEFRGVFIVLHCIFSVSTVFAQGAPVMPDIQLRPYQAQGEVPTGKTGGKFICEQTVATASSPDGVAPGPSDFVPLPTDLAYPCTIQVRWMTKEGHNGPDDFYTYSCMPSATTGKCEISYQAPSFGSEPAKIAILQSLPAVRDLLVSMGCVYQFNSPEVLTSNFRGLDLITKHRWVCPSVTSSTNRYYNQENPCDVNGDGRITPRDIQLFMGFQRRYGNDVNLRTHSGENSPSFVDVNNDWRANWEDIRLLYLCIQRR